MNAKKLLFLSLIALTVVAVFAVSAGSALAQGPQNGRGRGAGVGINAGSAYANGMNAAGSYGQNLQLHTPGTGIVDPSASLQLGTGNRYGQNGAAGMGQYGTGLNQGLYALTPSGELTTDAIAALTAGLTDEINAYNAYAQVIAQFGPVAPFVQIQRAEASHMAALEAAFTRYGLPVPEIAPTVEISAGSLAEACTIGAQAEIANAALYDQWISAVSDYPDLAQVFTALRNASQNSHLPAFEACAG